MRAFFLLIFLLPLTLFGAGYRRIGTLGSDNGLPHYQVNVITEDPSGRYWMGTRNGVGLYDGRNVVSFFHHEGDSTSLKHNYVRRIFFDSAGRTWLLTLRGISRYDLATGRFVNYSFPTEEITSIAENATGLVCGGHALYRYIPASDSFRRIDYNTSDILSMSAASDGCIYFSSNTEIGRISPDLKHIHQLPDTLYKDIVTGSAGIIPLFVDSRDNLWIGLNGKGVARYNPASGAIDSIPSGLLPSPLVRSLAEDSDGTVFVGTERGCVGLLPPSADAPAAVAENFEELKNQAVYTLLVDSRGNLWAGTYYAGVVRYSPQEAPFGYFDRDNSGIPGNVIRMMTQTSPDSLWIATEDGGVGILSLSTRQISPFTAIPALGQNIHSLCYDADNRCLWIGTFLNGLFRYNLDTGAYRHYLTENGLASKAIFYLTLGCDKRLYVATPAGMRRFNAETDYFERCTGNADLDDTFIYTFANDSAGNLWIGSTDKGLFRIDHASGSIDHWRPGAGSERSLVGEFITAICPDIDGNVWVGTNNNGIQILSADGTPLRTLGENTTVCAITVDDASTVWVSTSVGLFRYDAKGNLLARYTAEQGLHTSHMNLSSIFRATDGHIYVGSVDGLLFFSPGELEAPATARNGIGRCIAGWLALAVLLVALFVVGRRFLRRARRAAADHDSESDSASASASAGSASASSASAAAASSAEISVADRAFISKVDAIIDRELSNSDLNVETFTSELGMSRTMLHLRMKQACGMSIGQYLREKRFAEARRLLDRGFNVSETAYRSGFGDPGHFSKMFKRRFGSLPSQVTPSNT